MNQFKSLPLTAAQLSEDSIIPEVSSTENLSVDPDFLVDPDFSVPDYEVMVPSYDDDIDPDFSVMPPYYPDRPIYPPVNPAPMPCLFCNNNHWQRGAVRFLNAATGYNAFTIYIDNRPVSWNLDFPELTRYERISQGYHTCLLYTSPSPRYVEESRVACSAG